MIYNNDDNIIKNTFIKQKKNNSSNFLIKPFFLYFNKNNNLNNYIKDSNIQNKDNQNFLKKFKNNIEFIGQTGIRGLVKSTGNSLLKNKSNILPLINSYNINFNKLNNIINPISLNNYYKIDYKQNDDIVKKNNNFNKIFKNIEVYKLDNERGYKPHSYKDFKKMMKDYNNNRFGGLGENKKTLDWYQKAKKYKMKKDYSNNISKNKIGIKNFINDSIYEAKIKLQIKNMNSNRYKAIKYGKGVMLNKVRDEIRKRRLKEIEKLEMEKKQYEYVQKKQLYEQFLAKDKEKYIQNLKKLKESLLFD